VGQSRSVTVNFVNEENLSLPEFSLLKKLVIELSITSN
jgi:hypothetical protein